MSEARESPAGEPAEAANAAEAGADGDGGEDGSGKAAEASAPAGSPAAGDGSPAADAAALQRILDGEHADIRQMSRELLSRAENELPPADIGVDEHREQVFHWAKKLAEDGQTSLGFPTEFGGGGRIGGSIAAFEMLAYSDLSLLVKCGVQFGLFGGAVLHLGTRRHHERFLAAITSLELPGCFAMSESGHGSDVQSLRTTATYDPASAEIVVNTPTPADRKDWIGNAARDGRMAAVFAQLIVGGENHGVHAVLVPIRDESGEVCEGVRIEDCGHKLGLNGVDNGRLYFDNVRVPRENLLDRYGTIDEDGNYSSPIENPTRRFFTMVGTLVQGRVSVAGAGLSVSKTALTIAIRHGLDRRQFGPPGDGREVLLMDYRVHQRRLLPLLAKTYALSFVQAEMVGELERIFGGEDGGDGGDETARRELETKAAGIKALATWHAIDSIQVGRECTGGQGYLSANRFAALKDDAEIFTTFEGDNTILLQLVAKSLLTGYRDSFGELNPLGTAAFVAGELLDRIAERSAARELFGRIWDDITPSSEEEDDLANRSYQLTMFAWRAEHLLSTAARRLKGGIDAGLDPFEVFNAGQDHVLSLARAHAEELVLKAFAEAIEALDEGPERELLAKVCDLYALATIEAERAWYQEHGRISSTRSKAVIRSVNRLCDELRPHAGVLVEALAVPAATLPAFGPGGLGTAPEP